jgi:hypothetical protein
MTTHAEAGARLTQMCRKKSAGDWEKLTYRVIDADRMRKFIHIVTNYGNVVFCKQLSVSETERVLTEYDSFAEFKENNPTAIEQGMSRGFAYLFASLTVKNTPVPKCPVTYVRKKDSGGAPVVVSGNELIDHESEITMLSTKNEVKTVLSAGSRPEQEEVQYKSRSILVDDIATEFTGKSSTRKEKTKTEEDESSSDKVKPKTKFKSKHKVVVVNTAEEAVSQVEALMKTLGSGAGIKTGTSAVIGVTSYNYESGTLVKTKSILADLERKTPSPVGAKTPAKTKTEPKSTAADLEVKDVSPITTRTVIPSAVTESVADLEATSPTKKKHKNKSKTYPLSTKNRTLSAGYNEWMETVD